MKVVTLRPKHISESSLVSPSSGFFSPVLLKLIKVVVTQDYSILNFNIRDKQKQKML